MKRQDDLLRAIARRRKEMQRSPLNAVLDSVNAFGTLEDVRDQTPAALLCFGPKTVFGATWSAVVIWQRPTGHYNYKTLTLLGVWAKGEAEGTRLIVGTRTLDYIAPYYAPESYFKHLRKDFTIHYGPAAPPPDEAGQLYTAMYDPALRLQLRQEIAAALGV